MARRSRRDENDELVKFARQKLAMTRLPPLNERGEAQPWHEAKQFTRYPSKTGSPVLMMIHPGTHKYPNEAPALIVKLFKEHRRVDGR